MSQYGKLIIDLDEKSAKLRNLTELQRIDPFVEEILTTADHVAVYEFNIETHQWNRKDVEGFLFVVKRNTQPRSQFMVMNRRSTDNIVENLLGDFKYEVKVPYLLYRNTSQEVNGIWFYDAHECEEVANLFTRILNTYCKAPTNSEESPTKRLKSSTFLGNACGPISSKQSMEIKKSKRIDRGKILPRVAQGKSSNLRKPDPGVQSIVPSSNKLLLPHSAEPSKPLPISEPDMLEGNGLERQSLGRDDDGPVSNIQDVASESMISQSNGKFCPSWNVKNQDSLSTREIAMEIMSHLVPHGDRTAVAETTFEVLSWDGYDILAKQLLTHHGMVLKIDHATKRIKELVLELEKETNLKHQTEIALDTKTKEVNRLKEKIANLRDTLSSLELKNVEASQQANISNMIVEASQQTNIANMRANEAVKAKDGLEDTLLDHWLDGFSVCKEMVLTVDPTFDISRLVPPISESALSTMPQTRSSRMPPYHQTHDA